MISPSKGWLLPFVFLFGYAPPSNADAPNYVVEGFTLGDRVLNNAAYRSYKCSPSTYFAGFTWCQRVEQKTNATVLSSTVMHDDENGIAVYLMADVAPVAVSRIAIEKEIADLSREFQQLPVMIKWSEQRKGVPSSVMVTWGQIKLEELPAGAMKIVAAGDSPRMGVLVDSLGDLQRSAQQGFPVYRITGGFGYAGGPGYLYAASFDEMGRGHRHYVAIDASRLATLDSDSTADSETRLRAILQKDQLLAEDDYRLWPQVAEATRKIARETSVKAANDSLDKVCSTLRSRKLCSHVWSLLPGGAIGHLAEHEYFPVDIYGPDTLHPEIRTPIQNFLAAHPTEPFVEYLYYVIGEYDKALQANQNSVINDVLHYASGYKVLEGLLQNAASIVKPRAQDIQKVCWYEPNSVHCLLKFFNNFPDLYGHKPLRAVVPGFAEQANVAQRHFEAVLRDTSVPHADDAAYMLGWLAFQDGNPKQAIRYFSQAMVVGNGDYKWPPAMKQMVRTLELFAPDEQFSIVNSNASFAQEPAFWYVAARSAYHNFDYTLTIKLAEQGLAKLNISLERLPVTTDPERILEAIEKLRPELRGDPNVSGIPYLIEASREIMQYEAYLSSTATRNPKDLVKKANAIIVEYSKLLDEDKRSAHKDIRQATHLIDKTLESTAGSSGYAELREWLYYRKARILAVFAPSNVVSTVAAMEREFPHSKLLPNALAEQLYAQGAMMGDLDAAQATFQKLIHDFPNSNAVDNAYTWMAIVLRCEGREDEAQRMNREILRRFPMTRHAMYAMQRMSKPDSSACRLHEDEHWDFGRPHNLAE